MNPLSTYRIQFNKHFTFRHFEDLIPYFEQLGVGTIYASPVFMAVPESTHGYDVIDANRINNEIGSEEDLNRISKKLKARKINWLQDIVPNHMAFHTANKWLDDMFEKGRGSPYASFFDTVLASNKNEERLMVPVLGCGEDEATEYGELKLMYLQGKLKFDYQGNSYPVKPGSYSKILKNLANKFRSGRELLLKYEAYVQESEGKGNWQNFLTDFNIWTSNETEYNYLVGVIDNINTNKGLLKKLLSEQSYRLCWWQETNRKINYRRFFTVNSLICLNIHEESVFHYHHAGILARVRDDIFQGLRIDHIDGLFNPTQYLSRVRSLTDENTFIVVEKILGPGEEIPTAWPVQGTTGYDFLALVNNLFTCKENEDEFTNFYQELANNYKPIRLQMIEKKEFILSNYMAGELDNLYQLMIDLKIADKTRFRSIEKGEMKKVVGKFLSNFPVYRYYHDQIPFSGQDYLNILDIINSVRKNNQDLSEAVNVLEELLLKIPADGNLELNKRILYFYQRCMQFSGPLMAKGVEDTLMYSYNRFIAHNEVGDSLQSFGMDLNEFHDLMKERLKYRKFSINATSTHDTKRSEDVRARLNVLSDLPSEWFGLVRSWQIQNAPLRLENIPDNNEEYFIYQTLAGVAPMTGMNDDDLKDRLTNYIIKAIREAKLHSDWMKPNEEYENKVKGFTSSLLNKNAPFWKSFQTFLEKITDHGILNSLSQVILKCTCPGIPDIYQGCELWDLHLVDPDNRRTVDFNTRQEWLNQIPYHITSYTLKKFWLERHSGIIKLFVLNQLLQLTKKQPVLFMNGDYIPLNTEGKYKNHILSFARKYQNQMLLVIIPLHTAILSKAQQINDVYFYWEDTRVLIPEVKIDQWECLLSGKKIVQTGEIRLNDLFNTIPISVLKGLQPTNKRSAGILLHITSLPSPFGIGDLGPSAYSFADFLHRSHQKYWQLLPLNPTEKGQGHSPYSATSAFAGNTLLISLEKLETDGLLLKEELEEFKYPLGEKVNYEYAGRLREILFTKAWNKFKETYVGVKDYEFEIFKKREMYWLDDFALFTLLKKQNFGKSWYEWENKYLMREKEALESLAFQNPDELEKIKWLQYIFSGQWSDLRSYCDSLNIQFIGDLPFYVNYDSADVWAHKELFSLDKDGKRLGMAGVPPDAYSAEGQLWGMPVYNWEVLKSKHYEWWLERIKKNKDNFDLIRLDHFRAFASYWEVPATEQTAMRGIWKEGPGRDFFKKMRQSLGELPFIAEDLGEIDANVYELRDAFDLPGMKVLQFAFGEDMPRSNHIPHMYRENFIVYTGTHDNNTTRGWYAQEGVLNQGRVKQYFGQNISESEISLHFSRLAYSSVAKTVILPLQDLLGLDQSARMNTPSSVNNNWVWRFTPEQTGSEAERVLNDLVNCFGREQ